MEVVSELVVLSGIASAQVFSRGLDVGSVIWKRTTIRDVGVGGLMRGVR